MTLMLSAGWREGGGTEVDVRLYVPRGYAIDMIQTTGELEISPDPEAAISWATEVMTLAVERLGDPSAIEALALLAACREGNHDDA
jgi:hypothetical protein